jgi:hypothetical protein
LLTTTTSISTFAARLQETKSPPSARGKKNLFFARILIKGILPFAIKESRLGLFLDDRWTALSFALRHPFTFAFFIYGGGGLLELCFGIRLCDQIPVHLELGTVWSFDLVLLRGESI